MIELPDFNRVWDYENNFYLSCDSSRIAKIIAHYELYKTVENIPGDIVECGVFKGVSLCRFAMFRDVLKNYSKKIIGFDTFAKFPETRFNLGFDEKRDMNSSYWKTDDEGRKKHIEISQESISKEQLYKILEHKGIKSSVELIEGDITQTVPKYVEEYKDQKISLLNLDVDIFEPTVTILEYLYPRITKGGVLILDDYGKFPGETKAVDDYFKDKDVEIRKFAFSEYPKFVIK